MKTLLSRTVLAAVIFATLAMVIPGQAVAAPWCDMCYQTNDCLACCRCDGGTMAECLFECGYPADGGEAVSGHDGAGVVAFRGAFRSQSEGAVGAGEYVG